ncbi:MAG: anti-CBASS protein Acb1 family protein [Anaerotignum sp.]
MKNYDTELAKLYENNGLFAKIIDTPAEEALRSGFKVNGIQNVEILEYISESLDMLNWEEKAATALKWSRLFGGSIAVMLINDGGGLEDPVDWENIKSIDDIHVYDRSIIFPKSRGTRIF